MSGTGGRRGEKGESEVPQEEVGKENMLRQRKVFPPSWRGGAGGEEKGDAGEMKNKGSTNRQQICPIIEIKAAGAAPANGRHLQVSRLTRQAADARRGAVVVLICRNPD